MKNIIDLSLLLDESLPGTWPGQHPYSHVIWKDFPSAEEAYSTYYFTMDEHCGTHCDAPAHFIRGTDDPDSDLFGDSLDLMRMQGPLKVIDVRFLNEQKKAGISPWIEVVHVNEWETRNGALQASDIVVFQTGWDCYYKKNNAGYRYGDGPIRDRKTPGWPSPSVDTLSYLYEKGIVCLGIDSPSMGATHDGIPPHQFGLGRRMIYVEGLANLDAVPATGATFLFLPLKIARSTGCPGRAIAYIP